VRILQISDLHLRSTYKSEDEVKKILDRFFDILSKNAKEESFDFAIITGDIRSASDGIGVREASKLLDQLFESAGLTTKEQLHIVPGNHDLERKNQDVIKAAIASYDYDNGVFIGDEKILATLNERFDSFFFAMCDDFYGGDNPWVNRNANPHYLVQKDEIALIFLNSAITCQESAKDGRLILGRVYLRQLLEQINKETTKRILIFAHHPIKELQNQEKTALTNLLSAYSDKKVSVCWFCGDAHSNTTGDVDGIPYYQVGSLCMTQKDRTVVIPDFVIYEIEDDDKIEENNKINRRVFRFLQHLNSTSRPPGGWKRVYNEPVDLS
jgi:metallophosphoesterase superfamily enzyme